MTENGGPEKGGPPISGPPFSAHPCYCVITSARITGEDLLSLASWVKTENRATTSFGYCSSTRLSLTVPVRPHCTNARRIRCQADLNGWGTRGIGRRPLGRPRMKTTQQDLESMNLSLNEATDVAENRPLWRMMSTFGTTHSYSA